MESAADPVAFFSYTKRRSARTYPVSLRRLFAVYYEKTGVFRNCGGCQRRLDMVR